MYWNVAYRWEKCYAIYVVGVRVQVRNQFKIRVIMSRVYTSEDLKWDAPFGRISNQHWNPTLAEIKCPILFLQGFIHPHF
jgi:hypothetical protein